MNRAICSLEYDIMSKEILGNHRIHWHASMVNKGTVVLLKHFWNTEPDMQNIEYLASPDQNIQMCQSYGFYIFGLKKQLNFLLLITNTQNIPVMVNCLTPRLQIEGKRKISFSEIFLEDLNSYSFLNSWLYFDWLCDWLRSYQAVLLFIRWPFINDWSNLRAKDSIWWVMKPTTRFFSDWLACVDPREWWIGYFYDAQNWNFYY